MSHVDRWQEKSRGPLEGLFERGGMLKGSFVSEEGIKLQLFVPVSPRPGGLDVKGWGTLRGQDCRARKLAPLVPHPANLLCEYSRVSLHCFNVSAVVCAPSTSGFTMEA